MKTGFFLIDKPQGLTSHNVVSRMRKILSTKKVGHSGTLDPMATGVLIVGVGPCTRLLDYVQAGTKEYIATIRFGIKTTTADVQGETVQTCDMSTLTKDELLRVIPSFVGEIEQIPPMVSAIKVDGKKLYEYQRQGIEIERKPRRVIIEEIELLNFTHSVNNDSPSAILRIVCHAGTYIRTLGEDIASELGGFAYLTSLRRTKNGHIDVDKCISLETLSEKANPYDEIVRPQDVLSHYSCYELDEDQTRAVSFGQPLKLDENTENQVRQSNNSFFVVKGDKPRNLIAIYPTGKFDVHKSRCIVFLDEQES